MKLNRISSENRHDRSSMAAVVVLVAFLMVALFTAPVQAAIVYIGASSGGNNALPLDGSAGALTIPIPPGVSAGRALIASIAARPRSMTVTVPAGWILMTATDQPAGGVSTAPGGMTLLTYYKIATVSEPASYTWTFANPTLNQGGSAVGGILVFSGIDTSASPINAWSARLTPNGLTHATNSITPTVTNTMIVSSISYLSASSFANPTGIAGLAERLDVSAPVVANAIGTTLQMATAPWATATATGNSQAVAASSADTGVGHLMALRPSLVDTEITMTRSGPLIPGGSASYTLTVTNNGINPEPGPLTVVDTLPAGLSYASSSGGWTCNVAGQVVTCTLAGALAAGATAPALVLNVNVSAGASGTLTNTATVSGTGGDGNLANNTAVDSYTIPIAAYAYYAMDETSWGAVTDSSGNGRNGTVLGSAAPTGYPPASPPGSAIAGNPGTCGAGSIPVTAGTQAVNTGIDVNSIGNAGTINFWYNGNTAWNDGISRMLFDASNDLGGGGADKNFYLVKEGGGQLRFQVEDSADTDTPARTGVHSFAAGTWVHIAVTWDMAADRTQVYVNGVLEATSTTNVNGTLGNTNTLYLGDNRSSGIGGAPAYTANSANGYLDEVRLYASALTAGQIAADMNAAHACVVVDHFAINIGAAAASTCSPKNVTITAQDASNATVTGYTGTVNITTSSNHGDWSQSPATGILANGAADDGAATYTFAAADNGVVTLALTNHHADDLTIGVVDNTLPATASTSSTINFRDNAFVITNDTIQVAGRDQAMSVAMWRRDPSTGDCAIAAGYTGNKDLDAWLTLDPSHPAGATVPTIGALTLPIAAPAVNPGSNNLPLTFTNGSASFNLSTTDVGKYVLDLRDDTRTFATGVDISGTSSAITTRPFALAVSDVKSGGTDNPNGANATDAVFIGAGVDFEATIGAYRYNAAADGDNNGLPDATATLAQTTGGGLAPSFNATATLTPSIPGYTPAAGVPGILSNATFSSFSGGTQTRTDLRYSEVGSFVFDSAANLVTNYLGTAGVNLAGTFFTAAGSQTNATRVGRFIPHHFDVTRIHGCAGGATFTYSGQAFAMVTVTARNLASVTTSNYHDFGGGVVFSKDTTISDAGSAANFTNNVIAAATFINGIGNQTNVTYTFPTPPGKDVVPLILTLRAVDTDTVSSAGYTEETAEIRSGRVRIINAYGSELVALPVPMRVEYFSSDGWVTNTDDTCTTVPATSLSLSNNTAPPVSPPTAKTVGTQTTSATVVNSPFAGGDAGLSFSAPGVGGEGYVDVTPDLTTQTWLHYDWDGDSTEDDPVGRATFGLYRGSPRHIYQRERY